jgi:hypothetical protein
MGLIFVGAGLAAMLVGLGGYAVRAVREAEALLPDHDAEEAERSELEEAETIV